MLVDYVVDFVIRIAQQQCPTLACAIDVVFAIDVPNAHAFAVIKDWPAARSAAQHQMLCALIHFLVGKPIDFFEKFVHLSFPLFGVLGIKLSFSIKTRTIYFTN